MKRCHRMIFQYHSRFGQWHVPNLRAYVPHERGYYVVRTNRDGLRSSRDYAPAGSGAALRVLLFGDSFTAGEGVHNEERFSDRLERQWDGVEVINFGLDGSGIDQHWLIFEEMGDRFGGDLILLCPLVENIRRTTVSYWPVIDRMTGKTILVPKPYFTLEAGRLRLHHVPVPRARRSPDQAPPELQSMVASSRNASSWGRRLSRVLTPLKPFLARAGRYQPFPQYDSSDTPAWHLTRALLARVIEKAGTRPVVLAPLPLFYYIEEWSPPTYLARYREVAEAHPQVHLIDLLPYFHALPQDQRRACRFRDDIHYTPLGHSVVARGLATEFARLGLMQPRVAELVS